jgi:hypothetical protein
LNWIPASRFGKITVKSKMSLLPLLILKPL